MKEFDDIDQLFQTTFDGYEAIPDLSVKENIDRAIASKKKKRKFFVLFLPICVAIIAFGSIFSSLFSNEKAPIENYSTQNVVTYNSTTTTKPEAVTAKPAQNSVVQQTNKNEKIELVPLINLPQQSIRKIIIDNSDEISRNFLTAEIAYEYQQPIFADTLNLADSTLIDKENEPISLAELVAPSSDISHELVNMEPILPERKWYLTIFGGWEGESGKPFHKQVGITDFSLVGKESVRIQSSSFYGKVELNRRLRTKLHVLAGVGFKSTTSRQHASLYALDSLPVQNEITSSAQDSFSYFIRHETGEQIFRINSFSFPIGLIFSQPISSHFHFRLSLGTEFLIGWKTNVKLHPTFAIPTSRSFGCNAWLRPEIQYSLRKIRFIAFGTMSHTFVHQLKWNVETRRNPSFGGGLGINFNL